MPSDFDKFLEGLSEEERAELDDASENLVESDSNYFKDETEQETLDGSESTEVTYDGDLSDKSPSDMKPDSITSQVTEPDSDGMSLVSSVEEVDQIESQAKPGTEPQPNLSEPKLFYGDQDGVDNTPSKPEPSPEGPEGPDDTPPDNKTTKDSLADYPPSNPSQRKDDLQQDQDKEKDEMQM